MPKLNSERQLVRDLLPPEGPSDFPEESPEIARTLEKELKAGLKTLQQRKLEQDQWDKVLSQRELALVERDMDLANLEAEHQALRASYEQLQQDSKLGDDVMRFLAREGKVLAETLGELMLVRRLGPNRLEHLNLLARELQELRGRVLGYPVASWRAPPQLKGMRGSSSDASLQRALIPPRSIIPGVPFASPVTIPSKSTRRVQSAAGSRTKARLLPPSPPGAANGIHGTPSAPEPFEEVPSRRPVAPSHPAVVAWAPHGQQTEMSEELSALEAALAEAEDRRAEAEQQLHAERARLVAEQEKLFGEFTQLQAERAASHDSIGLLRSQLSGEAEKRKEHIHRARESFAVEFEAKAKEARVLLLQRQIARRIMYRAIARGWTSWVEMWEARTHALVWLRKAGNTMRKPDLSRAFYNWRQGSFELSQRRKLAERETATEQITMLLCRQFSRRMLKQDVARAWASWRDLRMARMHAWRLLKHAANHLRHPLLAVGFYLWVEHLDEQLQLAAMTAREKQDLKIEAERSRLETEMRRMRSHFEQKLARADEVKREALERQMIALTGSAAEQAAAREHAQREARVEEMRAKWTRRLRNQDVARAWTSWSEQWESRARALSLLRRAGSMLRSPKLTMGFDGWLAFLASRQQQVLEMQQAGLRGQRDRLDAAIKALREESDTKLTAAAAERNTLLAKIEELGGASMAAEAALAAQLATERTERARLVCRQITRRMIHRSVSLGFNSWVAFAVARSHARIRLRAIVGRLRRPELGGAFYAWTLDTARRRRQVAARALQQRLKDEAERSKASLEGQLRQTRFDVGQLDMLRVAHEDELRALKEKIRVMGEEAVKKNQGLAASAHLEKELKELRSKHQLLQKSLEGAEKGRREAEADLARQSASNQDLLERLLAEQRMSFQSEHEHLEREAQLAQLEIGRLRRDLEVLHELRTVLEKELVASEEQHTSQRNEYESQLAALRKMHSQHAHDESD